VSTAIRRALYGKMAGDTTLNNLLGTPAPGYGKNIYHKSAPAGATFPYVVFEKQSGVPTEAFTRPSAFETDIWMIKAVDRSSTADPAEAIADRLKALLNDSTLSISGGTLMYLRRQSDVEYPETVDGMQYAHVGALYRLIYE
jgi:hypothetical protein